MSLSDAVALNKNPVTFKSECMHQMDNCVKYNFTKNLL